MEPRHTNEPLFLDQERHDLNLHIDLCAKRYKELSERLDNIEGTVRDISHKIDSNKSEINKALIATAGTIIVAIISLMGVILTRLPIAS